MKDIAKMNSFVDMNLHAYHIYTQADKYCIGQYKEEGRKLEIK